MNDTKAEKLALARKKLREFELRRNGSSPVSGVSSVVDGRLSSMSNRSLTVGEHSNSDRFIQESVADEMVDNVEYLKPNVNGSSCSSELSAPNGNSSPFGNGSNGEQQLHLWKPSDPQTNVDRERLIQERNSAMAAYDQVKSQLEQLHSHYSQLHAAYSQLSNSGAHSDVEQQVLQLQSAMALMVEDKTTLQSELRSSRERCADLEAKKSREEHVSLGTTREMQSMTERLNDSLRLLEARNSELAIQRKLASESQAQLLSVQHERSEAQARLKVVLREKDAIEVDTRTLRKDLQMKELYLKQLAAHQSPAHQDQHEEELRELHARLESLQAELLTARSDRDTDQCDVEVSKRNFESYAKDLAEKNRIMESELDISNQHRNAAEIKVSELEDQLQLMMKDFENERKGGVPSVAVDNASVLPALSEEEVQKRIDKSVRRAEKEWEKLLEQEQKLREDIVMDKDRLLFEREQTLAEMTFKYRNLLERTNESRVDESEMLAISEQLQNEKATVSRAVAQNKELKEQLIEAQDRLMSLTEEKLQCELARQAAEHQVREFYRSRDLSDAGLTCDPSADVQCSESSKVDESAEDSAGTESDDRLVSCETEALITELENAQRELSEVRTELRRSHTQNEEMNQIMMLNAEDENQNSFHVELGQAMNRIHSLVAENEQIRESFNLLKQENEALKCTPGSIPADDMSRNIDQGRECTLNNQSTAHEDAQLPSSTDTFPDDAPTRADEQNYAIGSDIWARGELDKKFGSVMRRNAELEEHMEKLEHINMQLQLENDTIADHVVLYQHQRRLIRERLRAKDVQLTALENERARVVERCQELQVALMTVLGKTGALQEYAVSPKTSASKIARRASRSFSHSTVDELSGDEDVVVSTPDESIPSRIDIDERSRSQLEAASSTEEGHSLSPPSQAVVTHSDADVQRILKIISDISAPAHSSPNDKLHCTQCIGELKSL